MMVCPITIMGIFSYGWKIQPICLRPYHHRQIQPEHPIAQLVGNGPNPHGRPPPLRHHNRPDGGRQAFRQLSRQAVAARRDANEEERPFSSVITTSAIQRHGDPAKGVSHG
jgi:hypothetical protein